MSKSFMNRNSTKIYLFFCLFAVLTTFSGCKNFLNGKAILDEIESQVAYKNLPYADVTINALSDYTQKITPAAGLYDTKYRASDKINLTFTEKDNYQFISWKAEPENAVEFTDTQSQETTATIVNTEKPITISPVCVIRPTVTFEPENRTDGVAKNTPIVITFSHPMDISDEDLDKISITSGTEDLSENFENNPTINKEQTKITIIANRSNLINLTSGTKLITVTVPQSFHYLYDDKQITLKNDISYSYRINSQTLDKATINVSTVTGGDISYIGKNTYNLDEELTVSYTPLPTYDFQGWSITNSEGSITNENGILQISDQSKQTLTVKVLCGLEDEINISPVCNPKGKLSVNFVTKNGSITPAEPKQYYEGDEFTLTYTEGYSGYSFLYWKVIDTVTQQDITDIINLNYENSITTATVLKGAGNITITPECKRRPTVMSHSPEKTPEGAFRDAKIEVIFDQNIDENSIFFTDSELASIPNSYTLLPEGSTKESKNIYGYKDKQGNIYYKNITITDNNTGENCLQYYDAPFFDTPSTLIIPARSDNAPTAGKVIKVELDGSGFYHKEEIDNQEKHITLNSDCYWIYTVNSNTDIYPPSIPEGYKVDIYAGTEINSTSKRTEIEAQITPEWLKNQENLKSIYLPDNSITVDAYLFDSGSGLTEDGGLYLKAIRLYDERYHKVETKEEYRKDFNLTVSGTGGGCEQTVYFKQTDENDFTDTQKELPDGVYQLDFYGKDKNGNSGVVKTYYVLLDNTSPDKVEIEKATYLGYNNTIYYSFKASDVPDFDKTTITVYKNKKQLENNSDFTINGDIIHLSSSPNSNDILTIYIQRTDIFEHTSKEETKDIKANTNTYIKSIVLDKHYLENKSERMENTATIEFESIGERIYDLELFIDGIEPKNQNYEIDYENLTAKISFEIPVIESQEFSNDNEYKKDFKVRIKGFNEILTDSNKNTIETDLHVCTSPTLISFEIDRENIPLYEINQNPDTTLKVKFQGSNLGLIDKLEICFIKENNEKYTTYEITDLKDSWEKSSEIEKEIPFPTNQDKYYVQLLFNDFIMGTQSLFVYASPEFTNLILPSATNSEVGHYITATLEGRFFDLIQNDDLSKFELSAYNYPELIGYTPKVTVLNNNTATVTIPVSRNAGNHLITLKLGDSSTSKTFTIKDTYDWAPGDIIMSDNSIIKYEDIDDNSFKFPEGKTPIAVIFGQSSVTGKKLGVGIINIDSKIYYPWEKKDTSIITSTNCPNIVWDRNKETGDEDGSDNWDEICKVDTNAILSEYPAFEYAINYGKNNSFPSVFSDGWYLPTVKELQILLTSTDKIKKIMSKLNKSFNTSSTFITSTIPTHYSSLSIKAMTVQGNSVNETDRNITDDRAPKNYVLPIRAF